jgi:2-amino-4-hydroxy-6-hydroxymethyldihydropteridine diphosphokinase
MADSVIAYIGLGSNLETPVEQIRRALKELDLLADTSLLAHSSLYSSLPVGPAGQPDYINAVAKIRTRLAALDLLDSLQAVEQAHRRIRLERWGPRTLDLDLLMYADQIIEHPRLQVPHCRIPERPFVLIPWQEIEADLDVPGMGSLASMAGHADTTGLQRRDD